MTNTEFISQHKTDDVRKLALSRIPDGVDSVFCLQQIEAWQQARKKLPQWAGTDGLLYPPRLSMEQCSSETTALYKKRLVQRLLYGNMGKMVDLTGGFGIDFSYMAPMFKEALYVERQERLCQIAIHNFNILGLRQAKVLNAHCEETVQELKDVSLIYADPARRDSTGHKTALLKDCQPDMTVLQEELMSRAAVVMMKLSPMLDIQQALHQLHAVREVHVVSVNGECKELLLVMHHQDTPLCYHCVNLSDTMQETIVQGSTFKPLICEREKTFLYEPNASILKAGIQDALCTLYKVEKLHPFSHLFTSEEWIADFPGRHFRIVDRSDFSKNSVKRLLTDIKQANITVRNFPATVNELRKRLKLSEGGNVYLFATTMNDGAHILLRCEKVKNG